MGYAECLPLELVEEIFGYLSDKDLAKCSEVSVSWREVANADRFWRNLCHALSWKDPFAISANKSNFLNKEDQYRMPQVSDRLSPISDWKLCYCQLKYISRNWNLGRYVTHFLDENLKVPSNLSFPSKESGRSCSPFFPISEKVGDYYNFSIMRFDGKPTKVCQFETNTLVEASVVSIAENTIAYVYENTLKISSYEDGVFSLTGEHDLFPMNGELSINTSDEMECLLDRYFYFICMNSDYLIAGHMAFYFHIWDRRTWDKLGFFKCPVPKKEMTEFCIQGDCVYFAINDEITGFLVYEYDILERNLTVFKTFYYQISAIFSNKLYLIVILFMENIADVSVLVYNRVTRKKLNNLRLCNDWPGVTILFENDILFCHVPPLMKALSVPACEVMSEFEVGSYDSLRFIRHNLLCIQTESEVQVWDWQNGIKLYAPSVDYNYPCLVYHDAMRLVVRSRCESKVKIIGFW